MALGKTWYEPQEAAEKFGVPKETIMEWAEEGVVRSEREEGEIVRVNIDDIKLEMENFIREDQE